MIGLYSERISPDYSGSGLRVERHARFLNESDIPCYIITNTNNPVITEIPVRKAEVVFKEKKKSIFNAISNYINLIKFYKNLSFILLNTKTSIIHTFGGGVNIIPFVLLRKHFGYKLFVEITILPPRGILEYLNPNFYLRNYIYTKADKLIAISPGIKNSLNSNVLKEKCLVVPNGVMMNKYYSYSENIIYTLKAQHGINMNDKIILCVGRVSRRKGFDISLNVFKNLINDYNNLKIIFVGEYSSEVIFYIESDPILNNAYLNKSIILTGNRSNMTDYYNIATFLLFPSRNEGLGNAIIEAMACKLPVIANQIPGVTDFIIQNGINGYIVKSNDTKEYIEIAKKILNNDVSSITSSALETVKHHFADEIIMSKYIEMYQGVKEGSI